MGKKVVLTLLFFLLPTFVIAADFNLGNENIEAGADTWGLNYAVCNHYTTPSDLDSVVSISIYLDDASTGGSVKLAIWDGSSYNLISNSVSDPLTDTADGWYTYEYITPPTLTPMTDYCFGLISGGSGWKYRRSQDGGKLHGYYAENSYSSPSNLGSPSDAGAYEASLYITYSDGLGGDEGGSSSSSTSTSPTYNDWIFVNSVQIFLLSFVCLGLLFSFFKRKK